jgi:peptide/nickel transport system substrate-binding protein
MRLRFHLLGLALPVFLASACISSPPAQDGRVEQVLTWGRSNPMSSWEGDRCSSSVPTNLMVFDSLLRISADGLSVGPGLAESYSYDDTRHVYTLKLRREATFSNEQPVTADDVVFSVKTWKAGELSNAYYKTIKSARALEDHTVEIAMAQADTFLPALLTWCTSNIYPKNFAGQAAKEYYAEPIGAGPFMIASTEDLGGVNEEVDLIRNPHYWGADSLKLDGLKIVTVSDANQRVLRFQSGELDLVEGIDDAEMQQIGEDKIDLTTPQIWRGIALNTRKDALADPQVRKAISLAIDRDAIVSALAKGTEVAPGILPTNLPDVVPPTEPNRYDPDAARAILAASPVTNPLTYLYNPNEAAPTTIANVVADQLSQVGITVKLTGADAATMRTLADSGVDWDLSAAGMSGISPSAFDPASLLVAEYYPKTGASTKVLDKQMALGMSASEAAAREAAVLAIQNDGMAQAAVIGIAVGPQVYGVQERVHDLLLLPEQLWYPDGVALR